MTSQKPPVREIELWCVQKGERELHCVAVYMPTGIDLRLMEAHEFRRRQLCADAPTLHAVSADWHDKLAQIAWADLSAVYRRDQFCEPRVPRMMSGSRGMSSGQDSLRLGFRLAADQDGRSSSGSPDGVGEHRREQLPDTSGKARSKKTG